jgi:hypothetical protein
MRPERLWDLSTLNNEYCLVVDLVTFARLTQSVISLHCVVQNRVAYVFRRFLLVFDDDLFNPSVGDSRCVSGIDL